MASIPRGALIRTLEEALCYFPQWTPSDRALARDWIERTEVTSFYVRSSGGYVAGHGGPNRSAYKEMPVNGLVVHVGLLHAWPNDAEVGSDERIAVSSFRGSSRMSRSRSDRMPARVAISNGQRRPMSVTTAGLTWPPIGRLPAFRVSWRGCAGRSSPARHDGGLPLDPQPRGMVGWLSSIGRLRGVA